MIRKKIYNIIELNKDNNSIVDEVYSYFMIGCIILSLVPLMFKSTNLYFNIIETFTVSIFILDYLLRWITADFKYEDGVKSFIKYPFKIVSIIDLLSIAPAFTLLNDLFKTFRILRLIKVLRVFKAFKYSENIKTIVSVFHSEKKNLITVMFLAISYIFISALIIFSVEPDTFKNFFEALYWATVSLTTVGYGDISPVTNVGRFISMISSLFGIAVIAIPSGIITAGYLNELQNKK